MLEVYRKKYDDRVRTEVSYYLELHRRNYEVAYEMISDVSYYYSKYTIILVENIRNKEKIENYVYKLTPLLFSRTEQKRRLAILAKFVLYTIAITNNISIYKLIDKVMYHNNGNDVYLSSNAFIKSTYKLAHLFEKIYHP